MKPFRAAISIGRVTGGGDEPFVRITIEDVNAAVRVAEVDLNLQSFAEVITGALTREARGRLYPCDKVGLTQEVMQVVIPIPKDAVFSGDFGGALKKAWEKWFSKQPQEFRDAGWEPDLDENHNSHRGGQGQYRVTLRRWGLVSEPTKKGKRFVAPSDRAFKRFVAVL